METAEVVLIGATTENPSFELNGALLSRCKVVVLDPLAPEAIARIVGNSGHAAEYDQKPWLRELDATLRDLDAGARILERFNFALNPEGFLFPATYELKRHQPVSKLVSEQLTAFKRNFANVDMRYALEVMKENPPALEG